MNDHAKGLVLGREQLRCSIFYEIGKNRARIRFLSRVVALITTSQFGITGVTLYLGGIF